MKKINVFIFSLLLTASFSTLADIVHLTCNSYCTYPITIKRSGTDIIYTKCKNRKGQDGCIQIKRPGKWFTCTTEGDYYSWSGRDCTNGYLHSATAIVTINCNVEFCP